MGPFKKLTQGFTLIELMLVVAIIGLLAAIALPKFGGLILKSKEAAVKGKLGSLRSAYTLYYADNEGYLPNPAMTLSPALVPKYMDEIPLISIPTVPDHVGTSIWGIGVHAPPPARHVNDALWANPTPFMFIRSLSGPEIWINCSHNSSSGQIWSDY